MLLSLICFTLICHFVSLSSSFEFQKTFGDLGPKTLPSISEQAIKNLIKRFIGKQAIYFHVNVNPELKNNSKDVFTIEKKKEVGYVTINGSSGVAAAWGFHHYLKKYCHCHISWDADQISLPTALPNVDVHITANDWFRYYQNVCTTSYSFIWWTWERWEREIDWMAINGFNLALAFTGQEEIWRRVYLKLGLTQDEIAYHFSGPAFLSWNRMGNMRGWGGPLSSSWHTKSIELQKKIRQRMREFGVTAVLPAFAGQVPRGFRRAFPKANLTLLTRWCGFKDEYCCPYLLSPEDPLFKKVGSMFLEEYIKEFGTDHIYNCDTFNEMVPSSGNIEYLKKIGKSIFESMTSTDPQALWMLQGWIFSNNKRFWDLGRAESFLTSVPKGKMLVLDLQADLNPQHTRLKSFFGQPYIWCMLHNFGGTLGLHGSAEKINQNVFRARQETNSSMVGVGITPEGINQNYVIYDLMIEMFWRKKPTNLTEWFSNYSRRRYGEQNAHASAAWIHLKDSVYNYGGTLSQHGNYIVVKHPTLKLKADTWYNTTLVFKAWSEILLAASQLKEIEDTFLVDIVDVTRQALQLKIDELFEEIRNSYQQKNVKRFQHSAKLFLRVLDDMEMLLASHSKFLLGPWINSAKALATTGLEEEIFQRNARNQVTLWGPNGEIKDYANKQWSGLIKDYYKPRWEIFISQLNDSLVNQKPFRQKDVSNIIFTRVEKPFTYSRINYTDIPVGDSIAISQIIYLKWGPPMELPG